MGLRETNLNKMGEREFDALVVGGGINGAVAAAALSARGAQTALIDRGDWGGFTSQQSSNLIWGGIKYLENYEFSLVWDLCESRNRLMEAYPSNVKEIRFFTAVRPSFRWHPLFMFAGTWAYWLFGRGYTRIPRYLSRSTIAREIPSIDAEQFRGGAEYSDAYLVDNDARFVFNFVRTGLNFGAIAANYVELVEAQRTAAGWRARLRCLESGAETVVRTKVLVNAAGPYADRVVKRVGTQTEHRHVFAKGIHLLVDRVVDDEKVLTFFDETGRMFFVIPMGPRSVIGTTDTRVDEPESRVTAEDREFLFRNINACLKLERPLGPESIIAERCGVRPLVVQGGDYKDDDGQWFNLSRKHVLERGDGIVSMYGGKLTDCLNIGEEVVEHVAAMGVELSEERRQWFGEPPDEVRREFFRQAHLMRLDDLREQTTFELLSTRLWRRYGLRAFTMLEAIRREPAMDDVLIEKAQYLRCELRHAALTEMVTRLEDFMRRRSKIALVVAHEELQGQSGVMEACRILFGSDAERRYREYFDDHASGYIEELGGAA